MIGKNTFQVVPGTSPRLPLNIIPFRLDPHPSKLAHSFSEKVHYIADEIHHMIIVYEQNKQRRHILTHETGIQRK